MYSYTPTPTDPQHLHIHIVGKNLNKNSRNDYVHSDPEEIAKLLRNKIESQ
jgi:hypothetical protein